MSYSDPGKQRDYQRRWVADRKAAWLTENGPCIDCGARKGLQVDHAEAATKVTHRVWSWSKERRDAELAKCVVRCESCHRSKTRATGECVHGEQHGLAKLTEADVLMIRKSTLSLRKLAVQLGVDYTLVGQVRRREIWNHVP